jgi:hypothetical protein
VHLNGIKSTLAEILYGVPQESILGPLLFLIHINNFQFASTLTSLLYADDTSLFNESNCLDTLFCETNSELINVSQWFTANRLTLHPAKTRYILFSHAKATDLQLILMGQPIQRVSEADNEKSFKLVGINLDDASRGSTTSVKSKLKLPGQCQSLPPNADKNTTLQITCSLPP